MEISHILLGIVAFVLFLYFFLEWHYFMRSLICIISSKIWKKKLHVLDETKVKGICITTDIDTLLNHMNNARYLRELDFAKLEFYQRTGLYQHVRSIGGSMAIGASTIRYRRFIKIFSTYEITTKVIYWDEKSIFIKHKFITPKDNFVNAVSLCKLRLINCNAETVMFELISKMSQDNEEKKQKPELTAELAKWMECNEISSAELRGQIFNKF